MDASAYLHFDSRCEEAFSFYARTLGGDIAALLRWANMPGGGAPAGMEKLVMHEALMIGQATIFGSDVPPARYAKPGGFGVALNVDGDDDAERIFAALSEGGSVAMAMSETFFAHRFGMVTDRFAIPWMVLHRKG